MGCATPTKPLEWFAISSKVLGNVEQSELEITYIYSIISQITAVENSQNTRWFGTFSGILPIRFSSH